MVRVLNKLRSPVEHIPPGEVGEVEETPGLLACVRAGHLELQGTTLAALEKTVAKRADRPAPSALDMTAASARIRELEGLLAARDARIGELERAAAASSDAAATKAV